VKRFFDLPYFEAPTSADVSSMVVPGDQSQIDRTCQGSVARVLLREGIAAGHLKLATEQTLSGSEAYTAIVLSSMGTPHWSLTWVVVRGGFNWATDYSAWPWDSIDNVFSPWPEFLGTHSPGREAIAANIEISWERSAVNAGLDDVPRLSACNFMDLDNSDLNHYLMRLSEAMEDEDEDVLWGDFLDERFRDAETREERVEEARLMLNSVGRQLRDASYEDLLELSPVWGSDDELHAAVEWQYVCTDRHGDAMSWEDLPWLRQRELLQLSSAWVKGVAASLPSARPELHEWLDNSEDPFVLHVLGKSPH
jgi:hypothetical protein